MKSLSELAEIVRSKNAGPFEITLDIMFSDKATYHRVLNSGVINIENIAKLYSLPNNQVLLIEPYAPALAIKITIKRNISSGTVGDTDVYGAQQHAPLLTLKIPNNNGGDNL